MKTVTIIWRRVRRYDDAADQTKCVYVTVAGQSPRYVGLCDRSVFGGSRRKIAGRLRSPRYGESYQHWIDGFLQNGGRLYIGKCGGTPFRLHSVEESLIALRPPRFNKRKGRTLYELQHRGDVPRYLRSGPEHRD